jgi:hypothetical protein
MYNDIIEKQEHLTDKEFRETYCDICTDYECYGRGKLLEICKKLKAVLMKIKGRN